MALRCSERDCEAILMARCTCTVNKYRGEWWASPEYYSYEDPKCPLHWPRSQDQHVSVSPEHRTAEEK